VDRVLNHSQKFFDMESVLDKLALLIGIHHQLLLRNF